MVEPASSSAHGGPHRVVVVGGGFGGLNAVKALGRAPVEVTLVDRRNFHLFQPLLYQVATAALNPGDICSPLRYVLRRQRNVQVLLGEASSIDADRRLLVLSDGAEIAYDTLVLATGAHHSYFGHEEWAPRAPGLKTIEDAMEIRRRILIAFEAAEREGDDARRKAWLTFVVVGGGPTGVELAGALGEIANETLRSQFRRIDPTSARVLLLEGMERVLPTYPPELSEKAARALARLGVTVRTSTLVTGIAAWSVTVKHEERTERIPTHTVLWAAGVRASSMGKALAAATGCSLDKAGRVIVRPDLSVAQYPEIFVLGDLASVSGTDKPLPGVAPVAIQQGRYIGRHIDDRLHGVRTRAFEYRDRGNLATIGRAAAVADLGRIRFDGLVAWFAWAFVHILNLIEFDRRILVFMQWAVTFFTGKRGTRLITGTDLIPPLADPEPDAEDRPDSESDRDTEAESRKVLARPSTAARVARSAPRPARRRKVAARG
jgi:NADH dehydrogenase